MVNKSLFTSDSDEWATPDDLYINLHKHFKFELDAAADHDNNKCDTYYTCENSGLLNPWRDNTFCNPPFSMIKDWVRKAYEQSRIWGGKKVMLIPARTDTRYFGDYITRASEIYFIKGRLKFSGAKNSAPFPSVIVVFEGSKEGDRVVKWTNRTFTEFW